MTFKHFFSVFPSTYRRQWPQNTDPTVDLVFHRRCCRLFNGVKRVRVQISIGSWELQCWSCLNPEPLVSPTEHTKIMMLLSSEFFACVCVLLLEFDKKISLDRLIPEVIVVVFMIPRTLVRLRFSMCDFIFSLFLSFHYPCDFYCPYCKCCLRVGGTFIGGEILYGTDGIWFLHLRVKYWLAC